MERIAKLDEPKSHYLAMSAKERINMYNSDQKLPRFASENPSCHSHFSDHVESHPLTEFDDDLEDNLENILLSIKQQNDDLRNKIQTKRVDHPDLAGTMDLRNNYKIMGMHLNEFQTPKVVKLKTNTANADMLSPIKYQNLTSTEEVYKYNHVSHFESEEADFERDDNSEVQNRLNVSGIIIKSDIGTVVPHNEDNKGVTCNECTLLKS